MWFNSRFYITILCGTGETFRKIILKTYTLGLTVTEGYHTYDFEAVINSLANRLMDPETNDRQAQKVLNDWFQVSHPRNGKY